MAISNGERVMKLYADGTQVCDGMRMHIQGRSTLSCVPDAWQLDVYNPTDLDRNEIVSAYALTVTGDSDSVICEGSLSDWYTTETDTQSILTLVITDGEDFWRSTTSVAIAGGLTLRETVDSIMLHSTGPVRISAFPDVGKTRMIRGQAYNGKTVDVLDPVFRSISARAWVRGGSLYVSRIDDSAASVDLLDADLLNDEPHRIDGGCYIVRTSLTGHPVGLFMNVATDTVQGRYRIIAQNVDADTQTGPWGAETILLDAEAYKAGGNKWEGCT